MSKLTDNYPNAFTDFWGSHTPCIFKTGPSWPTNNYPGSYNDYRTPRPVYNHPITPTWLKTAWSIVDKLDEFQVKWNTINPLSYANAGQASLICCFIITIGVEPKSLAFDAAVTAAAAIDKILQSAGFPEIEVAFIESTYLRLGSSSRLMKFNPLLYSDGIPELRKPFTPTLSLAIAPRNSPHYEGAGGLFLRLNSDEADKRIVVLTCAHVSHPPQLFENKEYTRNKNTEPRENIILLGSGCFDGAFTAIMQFIEYKTWDVTTREDKLRDLPDRRDDEPESITSRRNHLNWSLPSAKNGLEQARQLFTHVTANLVTFASRIIGFVLHCAKIEVGEDGFLCDWSLVQLDEYRIDEYRIDWDDFKGNKLFVGGNKTMHDWLDHMFPEAHDHARISHIPENMMLPLQDYVPEAEFRNPQTVDNHNVKTLLAVKNGPTTGTTFGRVNGLESITRSYPNQDGVPQDALEFIVFDYDTREATRNRFSDLGDSGSFAVGRDGRLIAQLTGSGGSVEDLALTYVTPYYALQKAIKKKYPDFCLVPATS